MENDASDFFSTPGKFGVICRDGNMFFIFEHPIVALSLSELEVISLQKTIAVVLAEMRRKRAELHVN